MPDLARFKIKSFYFDKNKKTARDIAITNKNEELSEFINKYEKLFWLENKESIYDLRNIMAS